MIKRTLISSIPLLTLFIGCIPPYSKKGDSSIIEKPTSKYCLDRDVFIKAKAMVKICNRLKIERKNILKENLSLKKKLIFTNAREKEKTEELKTCIINLKEKKCDGSFYTGFSCGAALIGGISFISIVVLVVLIVTK